MAKTQEARLREAAAAARDARNKIECLQLNDVENERRAADIYELCEDLEARANRFEMEADDV